MRLVACEEIHPDHCSIPSIAALHLQAIALTRFVWGVLLLRDDTFAPALPAFGEELLFLKASE